MSFNDQEIAEADHVESEDQVFQSAEPVDDLRWQETSGIGEGHEEVERDRGEAHDQKRGNGQENLDDEIPNYFQR